MVSQKQIDLKDSITAEELINSDVPEQSFVVSGLIPDKGLTIIAGKPAEFKSFLAIHLAGCLASGKDFLKHKVEKCKVLYIDEENDDIEMKRRLKKIKIGLDISDDDMKNISLAIFKNIYVNDEVGKKKIEDLIKRCNPRVIIIDSLCRVMKGNENSVNDVREIWNNIKQFSHEYGISFIIIHHVRKTQYRVKIDDIRGSSDIVASASCVLIMNKENNNTYTVTQDKIRGLKFTLENGITFSVFDNEGGITLKV